MEEHDSADEQQAEAPNFPRVKIKEDEETLCPHLSKQFAFQPKRGDSYIMLCKLCLPRQTELSAYKNESSNLRKHVLVSSLQYSSLSISSSDSVFVVKLALLH